MSVTSGELTAVERDGLVDELVGLVAAELGSVPAAGQSSAADEARAHQVTLECLDRLVRDRIVGGAAELSPADEDELVDRVRAHLFGLGALDRLVRDPSVENVFCNGAGQVWVRRAGGDKERVAPLVASDEALVELIRQAAAREGRSERRFDRGQPSVSLRLSDGSRLTAVHEVSGQPVLALRRHRHSVVTLADLVEFGTLSDALAAVFDAAVRARFNILVVGGTDAGKTTMLRALLSAVPPQERLITVEDALELGLSADGDRHPDVVELECREANVEGQGEVTMRDLCRLALRLSPDRVIVGEARGPEILDMFQAMSQGNDGSMGTLHARSSADAFTQIVRYGLKAPERLTPEAMAVDIAASLDWVVHVHKLRDGRRVVSSLREVVGFEGAQVISNEVFSLGRDGRAVLSQVPFVDSTLERLIADGLDPSVLDHPDGGWAR